jgi:subtilisin-like proprotein convertase family protein
MAIPSRLRTIAGALLLLTSAAAQAQVTSLYTASTTTRSFSLITGGTVINLAPFDDDVIPITVPEVFFNGSYYSILYVSSNGFISFGSAAAANNYSPLSSTATYAGAVSPFGHNLKSATAGAPEIRWELVGNTLVVQWRDMARSGGGTERFSFQARFNRDNGSILFQYSNVTDLNTATTQQPQVGLRGPNNTFSTNIRNFTVGTGTETWAAPSAGTTNASTMRFTATAPAKSPAGTEAYTFTPSCLSPNATAVITSNCATNTFSVALTITSLGTGPAANITATPGGTLFSNVGLGTYTCGPFTLGTAVTLRLVNTASSTCTSTIGVFNPTPTCATVNNGECLITLPTIPDNGCGSGNLLEAVIPISGFNTTLGQFPAQTLFQAVELIIAHTYRGDIQVTLTSPGGQTRALMTNVPTPQAAGSNFGSPGGCPGLVLQLRDAGGQPLSSMNPDLNNITGIYTPEQSLSGFTGNPNGNWTLRICDNAPEDAGTLNFVRLRFANLDCNGTPNGTALPGTACNDGNASTINDTFNASCQCVGTSTANVTLAPKVFLEGPFDAATVLMHDSLRRQAVLPLSEPYTGLGFALVGGGGESTSVGTLATTGNNAIVDWVLVELRNATTPTTVVRSQCALVQRDGDVVGTNGTSALNFPVAPGNYHVAIRHRNHLGVMTAAALALSGTSTTVDFTVPTTSTFGTQAQTTAASRNLLWRGNVAQNNNLQYVGAGNDRDPILVRVGSTSPNNVANGYFVEDVNMDGAVRYVGAGNDRDPILVNVGSTTPNNIRLEQLP